MPEMRGGVSDMNDLIKDKIKKLLALSRSPNKAEAALAMEKAEELLLKHNLSLKDVSGDIETISEESIKNGGRVERWRTFLLDCVARLYFCDSFYKSSRCSGYEFIVVGKPHNIEVARSMYCYLENAILRMCNDTFPSDSSFKNKNNFKRGLVAGLASRIDDIIKKRNTPTFTGTYDLVVSENAALEKYMKRHEIRFARKSSVTSSAYFMGVENAERISLNDQLKSTNLNKKSICEVAV